MITWPRKEREEDNFIMNVSVNYKSSPEEGGYITLLYHGSLYINSGKTKIAFPKKITHQNGYLTNGKEDLKYVTPLLPKISLSKYQIVILNNNIFSEKNILISN